MPPNHDIPPRQTTAWADGERVPVANDHSGEEFLAKICTEFGLSEAAAMEHAEWFEENLPARAGEAGGQSGGGISERQFMDWLEKLMAVLVSYQDRQRNDPALLRLSTRTMALALKMTQVADANSPTELAKKLNLQKIFGQSGKATANKCFKHFQKHLRLSPLAGQRKEEAVQNMSVARKKQLIK